jgi:hypothetical protein
MNKSVLPEKMKLCAFNSLLLNTFQMFSLPALLLNLFGKLVCVCACLCVYVYVCGVCACVCMCGVCLCVCFLCSILTVVIFGFPRISAL